MTRRLTQLLVGLVMYGVSLALVLRAGLGLAPWDVLHQGLAQRTGATVGQMVIAVSFVVLLAWIPLRQRPGLGTVANVLVIGAATDATLALTHTPDDLLVRLALTLVGGVLLNGLAGAMYIGAQLGPGPRDGLMTGISRRTGLSLRLVRTVQEVLVVVVGFGLGGSVGLGTVVYAVSIGPIVHYLLPKLIVPLDVELPRQRSGRTTQAGSLAAQQI